MIGQAVESAAVLCEHDQTGDLMTPPRSLPTRLTFGPFEVDSEAGEVRKHGVRLRLSGQPLRILLLLLERPGELVSRDEVREQVWKDGTFVDFEGGLNAAINKLRRALNDSAENPRYIETVPSRGYRFIGVLDERGVAAAAAREPKRDRPWARWGLFGLSALCVAGAFALGWRMHQSEEGLEHWTLTRVTNDPGLSSAPALSPDGRMVAYSSDRGLEGERDLYIRQVRGGQPVRLTSDGAVNTTPDFSPDGSRIVFRSNRGGGGIYEIPALGGEPRLIARDGWDPKYSPDGTQVAYWTGGPNVAAAVPGSGAVWVVAASGGQPRQVGREFTAARCPRWFPDGARLLVIGYTSPRADESDAIDWWTAPVNGGAAVRTGLLDALTRSGLMPGDILRNRAAVYPVPIIPVPGGWMGGGVTFAAANGDTWNLWQARIDGSRVRGPLRRLTAGAGNDLDPSCASGRVAFTSKESRHDVWVLPLDLDRARVRGGLQRVTEDPAVRLYPSLTADGQYVAFASSQSGLLSVWLRDLPTGREVHLNSAFVQLYPVVNAAASRVAFSSFEGSRRFVCVTTPGGVPEKLCEGCLRATDWSRDEKSLLVFVGSPYEVDLLDIATHTRKVVAKHPAYALLYARFSPDNRWISFTARTAPGHGRIVVARVDGALPAPESGWTPIAEEGAEDWANWSPDGKTLYFTSGRDGYTCLWAQRLDGATKRPVGDAFAIQHLHGRLTYQQGGWSAAGGRVAMVLVEDKGNVWVMSRP